MIDRRTMLKVVGATTLGLVPEIKETHGYHDRRLIVAYIVTTDSWQPFELGSRRVITRTWNVYWSWHPELDKRLSPERYKWERNVKITPYYDINDFPPPAFEPLKFQHPSNTKKMTDYSEYHCFRAYDIDCSGHVKVIYDKNGKIR